MNSKTTYLYTLSNIKHISNKHKYFNLSYKLFKQKFKLYLQIKSSFGSNLN